MDKQKKKNQPKEKLLRYEQKLREGEKMQEEKDILIDLYSKISTIQKDIEFLKKEIKTSCVRSDEKDSAIRELVEEKSKTAITRQDMIRSEFESQIELAKKENELQAKQIEIINKRISVLENEKKEKVYSRWQSIVDKLFWVIVAIIFAAVLKYFNINTPK